MNIGLVKYRKLYGCLGAILAAIIAGLYIAVIPDEASEATGIQKLILIYGHSTCWILLSATSLLWAFTKNKNSTKFLAYAALMSYIAFISTLLLTKLTQSS